ncbi:MAG: glucodextranase DOMON-like domain-containing protein, partial [Candidatus Thermoplasmatota archaeon]|nr:glucodextranase DOMON-like domain-containing protein [Candidatus Thermoplasmatota archaeon]
MAEWYSRLADHPTIVTTTPSEFLTKGTDLPEIQTIGTGSWIDGTLRTWAGEEEESLAWQRLVEARQALVEFEATNPNDPGLPAAWESLYIAEGSDWYWWYGLDQDSGYDENWDVLFKVHLSNIYRAINLDLPPYLQDLWTNPAVADPAASAIIEPMIDGIALPGEWDGAARYDAPVSGGNFDIESFHFGYDASNVFIRVDAATLDELDEAAGVGSYDSPDLAIYFMQPNAVNFNEAQTNFRTYYGNQILGFPSKHMVAFDFDNIREDGRAKWDLFSAQGKVGDQEQWTLTGSSNLGGCAVDEVYEFSVPWADIGLAPRYSTRVKVVTSWRDSESYGDGMDAEMAPPAPAEMVLPDLEEWVTLLELDDAVGDETGDGDYVYPLASDFNTPDGGGLWDATHLTVRQSAWNAQFILTMSEMTDIWGLANGFSHQIVQIYVDQGETSYGRTAMLTGANAEVHPDWAWEVAISGTGEPGAVQAVQAETGSASARGIDVTGDVDAKTITFTVSKDVIGSDVPNYRYIIVIGSQDGFGTGKWRDVMEDAATWTLGGGANPAPDDGIDYDPNIIDVILEGDGQTAMLSGYDVAGHTYAQLTGFEMPEVPQQIFGASVDTVTSSSAVLTWSTTVSEATSIRVAPAGQTPGAEDPKLSTPAGTDHAVTLTGLEVGTSYWAYISANETEDVVVWFNTSSVVDETPPDLLNLAAEVLEDGRVTVSWYTSESATESVLINGESVHEDPFATKKNHAFTTEVLGDGTYNLEVVSADASGNLNSSTLSFTVDAGATVDDTPGNVDDGGTDESSSSEVSDTTLQVVALIVLALVLLAFLRVRGHEPDEDDPWN